MHTPSPLTLMLSTCYTQFNENIIVISRYWHHCSSTNQAKIDDDDEDLNGFHFCSSQESELDAPLVLDSVWDCPGITLDTTIDDDGRTIPGWHWGYRLIPGNCGGPKFFKHHNASKAFSHLTKGKDIVTCTGLWNIPANVVHALTALMYSKANRKHGIAV
jgi:hypothetical protein